MVEAIIAMLCVEFVANQLDEAVFLHIIFVAGNKFVTTFQAILDHNS
jgi:hypothetical protein